MAKNLDDRLKKIQNNSVENDLAERFAKLRSETTAATNVNKTVATAVQTKKTSPVVKPSQQQKASANVRQNTVNVNLADNGNRGAQAQLNDLKARSKQLQTELSAAKTAGLSATAEHRAPSSYTPTTPTTRRAQDVSRELDMVRNQIRNVRPVAAQQTAAKEPSYDNYDLSAAKKNLQGLKSKAADADRRIRSGSGGLRDGLGGAGVVGKMREQKADLERQIQAQEMEIRKAEYYKKSKDYAQLSVKSNFSNVSRKGSLKKGNNVMWVRNHADQYKQLTESGHGANGKDGKYLYMTEDEVKTYNYLFATDEKKAKEYLDFIEDALNYRMGTEMGEKVRGIDNDFGRFAATTLYGVYAGLDQFMSGATQFLSDDQRPTSAAQYGSAYVREDLADYGGALPGWMGGASLAQAAYDTVTTTANMAPSILLSSLTGGITGSAALAQGVGAATLGASAAGNAYGQALAEGYDKKSARIYSTMVGISEAYLQNVLGGITALGGLPEKTARWVANWDNALLRASANVGLNMLGEGAEEYLQDILEPALRNAILLENNSIDLVTPEAIYSGLLGALTAGFMEGPSAVSTDIQRNRYGAQLRGNHMDKNLIEVSLRDMDQSTQAYQTAKDIKSGKLKDSTHNLGTLFEQYVQEGGDMTVFDAAPDGRGGVAFNTGSGGEAFQRAKGIAQSRESGYTERVPERLDDITTDYVHADQGGGNHMSLAKAQEKADILSSYAAGEQVSAKDINKLGLTQTSLREVFERYTGVTLPEDFNKQSDSAKIQTVMRLQPRPEVSAAQVAEQSRVGGFAKIRPYIPTSAVEGYDMTPVLAPDGIAAPGMPGAVIAPRSVVESVKDGSLGPGFERVEDQTDTKWAPDLNAVSIKFAGKDMTLSDFSDFVKTLPDGDKMTTDEVRQEFIDNALAQGVIGQSDYDFYKEGMSNGTARSERTDGNAGGLAGRTGERPGERSGGVDQATGRAEAQSGSGRADADAGGRGRGAEVSGRSTGAAGQVSEGVRGAGSAREGTEREDRRVSAARKLKTEAVKDNKGREVMKRVTDEAFVSTEDGRELNKLFRSIGVEVRGMVGLKTLYNAAGKVIGHADGEAVPGRLTTIRVDSPRYTPGQLGRHEFGHQVFHLSDGTFAKAKKTMLSKMSAFELLDTEQAYRRVFADIYRDNFKEQGKELTDDVLDDMLIEEMLCDAYAGIDRAGTQLSVYRDTVTPVIEEARQTIQKNRGLTEDGEVRHSIDSLAEAAGLFFEKNGQATVLKDSKGKEIDKVTEEMITKSPLGAVIQAGKDGGFIDDEQVEKQTKFFADLYNLILKTQDVDMLWAVSSSIGFQPIESGAREHTAIGKIKSKFAGFTKNSDPQYSSTVDFTTICLKTQAVIDAMSETMKKLGHGLTEDEIVNIVYKNTHEAGEPVPCPVCYVFSRWVGLGGLFDKMLRLQAQYADADPERIRSDIAELENRVREYARSHDLDEFNKSGKLNSEARDKLYKTLWKEYDELSYRAYVDRVKGTSAMTDKDKARMEELKPIIQYFDNWTWLTDVRLSDNYQAVPADVLLDINAGKTFAEDYPESWRYRTTRGPAMGKAATPYADEHLGQILRGVGMGNLKDLGDNTKNPFLNKSAQGGKLGKAARAMLEKSRLKMKIQNLLNGQRFQSTSDFRFEYALDYLTAFLEMQTLGGKVQLYTKVPEAVSFFATVNAEVNCSLMPLGEGVTTDADGNRVLTFSNVTGMNAEDAFRLQSLFDNVQTILVGVGDEHIRIAMQDDRIQFIIPYHASGASEARYKSLMDVVGESVGSRADYSDYQTDHKIADATQTQKDTAEVRLKLLTGKLNLPDASEKALVRNHPILSELYKRFYGTDVDGNQSAIDPRYLAPELREGDVYRDPECFGAFLSKDQAEHIMPFEYWDRTSTTETADDQGQAFVDYCETLGLHPRFSGWDAKGKYHAEKDFTKVPGYWKTLGDRRLYNNDGTYHEQKAIDVTGMKADFLFREPSEQGIVQPSRANDRSKTEQIAEKSAKEIRELRQRNLEDLREQETAAAAEEPTSRAMKDTWKAAKAIDDTGARYSIATELENNEQLTDADRELLTVTQSVLDKVDAGKGWTGREVNEFYRNNPEYDFVARFFDGDKGTKKSMQAFVARIHDLQTLNALSWYSTQNHWDPAGRYRGSITKARNVYKARIDELARDLGGQPIKLEHRAYTLKEARDLFDQYNTNEALAKLADKVFPLAERFRVQVYASSKVYDKAFGKYSGMNAGPYVWLNRSYFGDSLHVGQSKASTILHEMIHSVTVYALDPEYRNDDIYSDPNIQEAVNRLEEVYNEVKADSAFAGDYGITNIKEFTAELANVKFREKLAKKNLLQRVIDAIRKFFGIETETALDGASAALDYLLDNVDEAGLWTYHHETRRKTERWEAQTGKVRYSISPETEARYKEDIESSDPRAAYRVEKAVREAANAAGYTTPKLYHGTDSFGFTKFRSGLIFATPDSGVAAGYANGKGYADPRKIREAYREDDGTDETLIQNTREVLHKNVREITDEDLARVKNKFAKESQELNDRVNAAYDFPKGFPDLPEDVANGLSWMCSLPGEVDANLDDIFTGDYSVREIEYTLDRIHYYEENVKEFFAKHRKEILDAGAKDLYRLVAGFDLSDYTIDVEYQLCRALHRDEYLVSDINTFVGKTALRDQIEQYKTLGAYTLYGNPGENPLVVDAKGAFWSDIKVPELGEKSYPTDWIALKAKDLGYTSVLIKNVLDPAMNNYSPNRAADEYIFFDSNDVKSADPVTYDDNGNVLPLGERFNRSNDDIRYSISPELRKQLDELREDGLGAANAGEVNTDYDRLQAQSENFHDSGPAPARHTDVPKQDFEGRNIPKSASTVYGANGTTDSAAKQLEGMIASGELSFDTETDTRAVGLARRTLNGKGFDGALEQYRNNVNNGTASKDNVALGQQLLLQAMHDGNDEATAELLTLYTRNSTTVAQALQAQSMFRKLSPEGQLIGLRKAIEAINEKYGTNVELTEDEVGEYTRAGSQEEREKVHEKIVKRIAETLPRNFKAKFDAIRYLAMLGNPRTHIRNILGNALFQAPVIVKNRVGAVGELLANAVSGGKVERTKSLTGIKSPTLIKEAQEDFKKVKDHLGQINKYNENKTVTSEIEQSAPAFSNGNVVGKTLNTLAEGNSNLLELEDMAFKRYIYVQSLAGYLQANGIQSIAEAEKSINGRKVLVRAREYAAQEAMRNTFNDRNQASDAVSSLGKLYRSENKVARAAGYVVEGVVPFKRTPTNILVRALEYSPAGVLNGIYVLTKGVKGKNSTEITRGIDRLAAGVSGSALFALGMMLAAAGRIKGGEDDDEKQKNFDSLRRRQNYSIELDNGKSVTLDWLAPEAIPFFMGVEMYSAALEGGLSWEDLSKVAKNTTSPMLEMSMLQGLNDAFDNAAYAKNQGNSVLGSVLASALTSYVTQVFPTILGQAERTAEDQRMTTYTDKNSSVPTDLQYTLGKVSQKVPHWDYNQIPFIDAWGRTTDTGSAPERAFNNMANPAYVSQVSRDPVEDELQRLYDATGESVLPERATKKVKINKEEKNLTAEEYITYATQLGQDRYNYVSAFIQSGSYAKLDDAARAKAIKEMYEYADKKAKSELFGQEPESDYKKITAALTEHNISPDVYTAAYARTSGLTSIKDKNGKTVELSKSLRIMKEVYQIPGLSKDQIQYLAEVLGAGKTVLGYSEKMVNNKLQAMENKYGKYNP